MHLLEVVAEESGRRVIKTPWGDLVPSVDLFPLAYLIVLYGMVYFLPFGISIMTRTWALRVSYSDHAYLKVLPPVQANCSHRKI